MNSTLPLFVLLWQNNKLTLEEHFYVYKVPIYAKVVRFLQNCMASIYNFTDKKMRLWDLGDFPKVTVN